VQGPKEPRAGIGDYGNDVRPVKTCATYSKVSVQEQVEEEMEGKWPIPGHLENGRSVRWWWLWWWWWW